MAKKQAKRTTRTKRSPRVELPPPPEDYPDVEAFDAPDVAVSSPPNDLTVFQEIRSQINLINHSIKAHKATIQELFDNRAVLLSRLRELQEKIQAEIHLPPNV